MKTWILFLFFLLTVPQDGIGAFIRETRKGNNIEDEISCGVTKAGRGQNVDSNWCEQNCKQGRHPACNSIGDREQLCKCENIDLSNGREKCRNTIRTFKNAPTKCFVFDEDDCIDKDYGFGLSSGETISLNKTYEYYNNVAAIAVQAGCYLEFWTGENFTGDAFILSNRAPRVANAKLVEGELDTGIHVSFNEFLPLGKLRNNIKSFKCVCR